MIIKAPRTGTKGRFVFRALIPYVARQAGVAAIRVGGGLSVDGNNEQWIKELQERAEAANCRNAGKHVVVSLTHAESDRLGHDGLKAIMDDVTRQLGLINNQRLGAVHVDAGHLHMHEVYSIVRPNLSTVFAGNDNNMMRRVCLKWEKRLGISTTSKLSRISGEAKNLASWTRLPLFASFVQIAGRAIGIAESKTAQEYVEKWATLGIWYTPRNNGGILSTMSDSNRIVHIKASVAGFTPPREWRLSDGRDIILYPSSYKRAVELAENQLFVSEPTYATFLREREAWTQTGLARGRAIREALRAERVAFDLDGKVPRPDWSELEAAIINRLFAHARVGLLARHAVARQDIADHRPDSAYGIWLKDRARSGDVAAGLVLARSRAARVSKSLAPAVAPAMNLSGASMASAADAKTNLDPAIGVQELSGFEEIVGSQAMLGAALSLQPIALETARNLLRAIPNEGLQPVQIIQLRDALAEIETLPNEPLSVLCRPNATDETISLAILEALTEKKRRRTAKNGIDLTVLSDPESAHADAPTSSFSREMANTNEEKSEALVTADLLNVAAAGDLKASPSWAVKPTAGETMGASPWASALAALDEAEQRALSEYRATRIGLPLARLEAIEALATLTKRAQVNALHYPKAAIAGELAEAPEKPYRSASSRFEHDRLQRSIASLEIVPSKSRENGSVVFIGNSPLPSFFATPNAYRITPLTGTHTDSMKVAILAAQRRWGTVTVAGNDAFTKAAIQTAAELNVAISNPELQAEWHTLRDGFERRDQALAAEFLAFRDTLKPEAQQPYDVFGREAHTVSHSDLADTSTRTTAQVILRGVIERDQTECAVLEAESGRLQILEITPNMKSSPVILSALQNDSWTTALAVTSGGNRPVDIALNDDTGAKRKRLSSHRAAHARIIMAAQIELDRRARLGSLEYTAAPGVESTLDGQTIRPGDTTKTETSHITPHLGKPIPAPKTPKPSPQPRRQQIDRDGGR